MSVKEMMVNVNVPNVNVPNVNPPELTIPLGTRLYLIPLPKNLIAFLRGRCNARETWEC